MMVNVVDTVVTHAAPCIQRRVEGIDVEELLL